jgi:phospholipid/cholesterol/gamma-HCH transport system substrate-binding protein
MTERQASGAAIAFEQVEKGFDDRKVLDKVSFTVAQGEALCILGRSGTGKSVTLKLMIGRQLVPKIDDTLNSAKASTQNLDQTTEQINTTLKSAFVQDQYGEDAGTNLQQSLTNLNQASGNLTDDTEALKHEFLFKGFFKHRGYDNLDDLPAEQYRAGQIFKSLPQSREWMDAGSLFTMNQSGEEVLSANGRQQIDQAVGQFKEIYDHPLIIGGYASSGSASDELVQSRRRATLVQSYLQLHYHLQPKNTGIVALRSTPPENAGKTTFDGVSLVSVGRASK